MDGSMASFNIETGGQKDHNAISRQHGDVITSDYDRERYPSIWGSLYFWGYVYCDCSDNGVKTCPALDMDLG